LLLEWSF